MQVTIRTDVKTNDTGILFSVYGPPKKSQRSRAPIDVNIFASSGSDQLIMYDVEYLENIFD